MPHFSEPLIHTAHCKKRSFDDLVSLGFGDSER